MTYKHHAKIPADDGSPITFQWHFPRGTLEARMSGFELATFVLSHMPAVMPLLSDHPRVQREFQAMLVLLATSPKRATHRLLPWIRSVIKTQDDDIIHLSLFDKNPQDEKAIL